VNPVQTTATHSCRLQGKRLASTTTIPVVATNG